MKPIQQLYILLSMLAFGSCQKVVTIDLNSTDPKYVIEGTVVDSQLQNVVKISRSINFDQDNSFPAVSSALVVISDVTLGIVDTLTEITPGIYVTSKIIGQQQHKYSLYVKADGKVFTSTSTMPVRINIDTLYAQKSPFRGDFNVVPQYTDPTIHGNYYQFTKYVNGVATDDIYIRNDDIINGQVIKQPLNARGPDSPIEPGDFVRVDLNCIDSATYQYLFTLQDTKNQNSATPSNPQTNLTGGALGYFSARTSDTKFITIPE